MAEAGAQPGLSALGERVHEAAGALTTGDSWARCLRLAARMPAECFANIVLLDARSPGAVLIRGYSQWREAGRQVRRGEAGTTLFAVARPPGRPPWLPDRDGNLVPWHVPGWRDAGRSRTVWDISQTSGTPVKIQEPDLAVPDTAAALYDGLSWLARRAGYAVAAGGPPPGEGRTDRQARRITVPHGPGQADTAWALAHQLGHLMLHPAGPAPAAPGAPCCSGTRRAEADSVAYLTCTRYGLPAARPFTGPPAWAGTDPRARPAAAILAAGERAAAGAARMTGYLDARMPARQATLGAAPAPPAPVKQVLADAQAFFTSALPGSWAQDYLRSRRISDQAAARWGIGRAPPGWTALTDHLRQLGHADQDIMDAGLARPSSRGTLIDIFRDRVTLPVHDPGGLIAGFTARARPGGPPGTPKYLNSPETPAYRKGSLLFGLHQARPLLAAGAAPVITEGPFDAIAVTIAGQGRHAGVAPCGTALTSQQAALLAAAADLAGAGLITAFDSDIPGQKASARAYGILRPLTAKLQTLITGDRKDPAEILQRDGPAALAAALDGQLIPLSAVIIDTAIDPWRHRLHDTEGPLLAMRAAASVIAGLLLPATREQLLRITSGRHLRTTDDLNRPVEIPDLDALTAAIPADTAYQVFRTATQVGFDVTDVLAETVNAVTAQQRQRTRAPAPSVSFPRPPLAAQARQDEHAPARRRPAPITARVPRTARLPPAEPPASARRGRSPQQVEKLRVGQRRRTGRHRRPHHLDRDSSRLGPGHSRCARATGPLGHPGPRGQRSFSRAGLPLARK